jgi:ferrous iron transport protein A
MTSKSPRRLVLGEMTTGARVVFRGVNADRALSSRLAALGLVDGAQIEVLQNSGHGPVLVRVHNTRVALGHDEAMKVLVEEIDQ